MGLSSPTLAPPPSPPDQALNLIKGNSPTPPNTRRRHETQDTDPPPARGPEESRSALIRALYVVARTRFDPPVSHQRPRLPPVHSVRRSHRRPTRRLPQACARLERHYLPNIHEPCHMRRRQPHRPQPHWIPAFHWRRRSLCPPLKQGLIA